MKPIVTVIMPVYNAEKYLEESIESILNQSFKDFELLVINDGSTDLSSRILDKYKLKDQRIRIINNEGNKGLPYTRDRGLKLAKGKYIALIDADDVSYKNRLEEQVNYLDFNKEIDIVSSNFDFIENGEIRKITNEERKEIIFRHISLEILEKGEYTGIREMRKHICYYLKGLPTASEIRNKINHLETEKEVKKVLTEYFSKINI